MSVITKQRVIKVSPSADKMLAVLLLIICSLNFSLRSNAQGFLKANGKQIVNEKGENVLLKGMGLGGWMLQEGYMLHIEKEGQQHKIKERLIALMGQKETQEFYDAWLANFIQKIDIDSMHAWGFNSVRLPMHYNLYTLPVENEPVAGQNTWIKKGFALTDSLVKWCKANHMYLVLDLHAAPGGQGNDLNISDADTSKPSLWASDANQQKTIALWKELATRYANEPTIAGYDILNEPNFGFTDPIKDKNGTGEKVNAPLKKLLMDITVAIREADKKHLIIIEGNGWGNNYNGMLPTWDNNMVLSFHKYWNYNDLASIQHIVDTRNKYNVPVWLGETGENSNVWFTAAIRLLESNNIGWAWWPLKKMGANNPLEIKSNLNYDAVANYLNGKGDKPKESNVYSGLLELATYAKLQSNTYHKDVIDAMMRQPFDAAAIPYKMHLVKDSSLLHAVEYDMGRNGIAYYDTDTADYRTSGKPGVGNRGGIFRNDGVDIHKSTTLYDSYYVSDIEDGEWLQFTIEVAKKGVYTLQLSVAAISANGNISLSEGTKTLAKNITVPSTGGWDKWQSINVKNVALPAGKQTLKIMFTKGGFNLQSIKFIIAK